VVDYTSWYNERWYYHTKHAKSKLAILNGHYGLYYTMYNHDEKRPVSCPDLRLALTLRNFQNSTVVEIYIPNFTISQANIQIYQNLHALKNVLLKQLFSPLSIIIPKLKLTSKRYYTQNHKEAPKVVELNEDDKDQISRIKESVQPTDTFLYSQINKISELHRTNEPENLDLIYPIYQAIIRNGLSLPTVELYDIVLSSIVARNLDSKHDIESIESKLTTLLTVYQHLLHQGIKPSTTTYNIIINELLSNSLTVKNIVSKDSNQFALNHHLTKSQEFAKMGIDIFESIKQFNLLDLDRIFPNLLSCLINFPELGSQNLMSKIIATTTIRNEQVCTSLIELTSSFAQYPMLFENSQERYKYIVSIYSDYKDVCAQKADEFKVYSLLIQSLVCNGHIKLASKFLDDILSDYKLSILLNVKPTKQQISQIISSYVLSIMKESGNKSLNDAFSLLLKFNRITYLPELSTELYNEMIVRFIHRYYDLQAEKNKLPISSSSKLNEVTNAQVACLEKCWDLYSRLAIRKDYQNGLELTHKVSNKYHCRDLLLSLSIELCDHTHIFQIIKEVLLKKHLIFDVFIFKKLLSYLYYGVTQESFNHQYYGLIWSLVETQSNYYKDSKSLNNFISEIIDYLIIVPNHEFVQLNVKQLMNSTMIQKALDNLDYHTDNLYAISVISNFLIKSSSQQDVALMNKVVHFQASLINHFEDTENYYIQLNEQLQKLQEDLKSYFLVTMEKHSDHIDFTTEILNACATYNVAIPENARINVNLGSKYEVDLSYLLNINYQVGVQKFMDLFGKSYNFNLATWEIIVNHNFAHDILLGSRISVSHFVERIFEAEFDMESKLDLLHTLVKFDLENIDVEVVKFLIKNPSKLTPALLGTLADNVKNTQNKYLKLLIVKDSGLFFTKMHQYNSELSWNVPFMEFLVKENMGSLVLTLFERDILTNKSVDYKLSQDELQFIICYLNACISSGDSSRFNKIFRKYFVENPFNKVYLQQSNELIELLIEYYLTRQTVDGLDIILAKFKPFEGRSQRITEQLLYSSFLKSIHDGSYQFESVVRECKTLEELSLRLICCGPEEVSELVSLNKPMIRENKQQIVSIIFQQLINASKSDLANHDYLKHKFMSMIKAMKHMNIKRLSVLNLSEIITYLTLNNCNDILHVIILKFINNNQFANVINLYFLETVFKTKAEQSHVLNLLYQACNYVNDTLNIAAIKSFSTTNNIKLSMAS